ncbi:MAG: DUF2189 domain-containing protein [Proteobacteria bacterium]|nr:DUF2189 domain-containing protein [Pseudomonadota bacterium]
MTRQAAARVMLSDVLPFRPRPFDPAVWGGKMAHESSFTETDTGSSIPDIRKIGVEDLKDALSKGVDDFNAMPTHLFFVAWIYPLVMFIVIRAYGGGAMLPLLFPILAGYTLFGPLIATGMYELSRRRESGLDHSRRHLFAILGYRSISNIAWLGIILMAIYFTWLTVALTIYDLSFSGVLPGSFADFTDQVFFTPAGWTMIVVGCSAGLLFAAVVFAISAVSFPLLLDRDVSVWVAIQTSVRVVVANPFTMMIWGIVVAVSLLIGSLPLLLGLAVVMPVLGHATWHLYRKAVPR